MLGSRAASRVGNSGALAGALVGLLHDGTGRPLAAIMAVCGIGAWLCHRLLTRHHEAHHAGHPAEAPKPANATAQ